MTDRPIGLSGVGFVGAAPAGRLIAAGYAVIGYDIAADRNAELERLGGVSASSGREVAERTDRVFLSLFDSPAVLNAVEGGGGLLSATKPPPYILDTTTGDPDETVALEERLKAGGVA